MKQLNLKVNGQRQDVNLDPGSALLFVLSDELGLHGPRFGCGMAQCGAWTVITKGRPVQSCVVRVTAVGEEEVTTLKAATGPACPIEPGAGR